MPNRRERGDWQTPEALAHEVLARVQAVGVAPPACVLEPTCGTGTFLAAAAEAFPNARLVGYELNAAYAKQARARVQASALAQVQVRVANFFELDWRRELATLPDGPLWIVGNPPWVTSATLGTLGSRNLPRKQNSAKLKGLDARTGKSNFDVSEWMLARLLEALHGRRDATLAMLCKASVARKLIVHATTNGLQLTPGGLWRIDSRAHFQAAVDAVLFVARTGGGESAPKEPLRWPVHDELRDSRPRALLQLQDGSLLADAAAFARTAQLAGRSEPAWRSGLKHDCARVMELRRDARGALRNGLGRRVQIEDELVFPLLKSSHVAHGASTPELAVIVPQRSLNEDTRELRTRAPRAFRYLRAHRAQLAARKSSIYQGRPEFSVFGVGPYSFAPWKVAISGLYKRCTFTLVGPHGGKPVLLDDTCYFLPFEREADARAAWAALCSPLAQDFFAARIFWDDKRPIRKSLLSQLDLRALLDSLGAASHRAADSRRERALVPARGRGARADRAAR